MRSRISRRMDSPGLLLVIAMLLLVLAGVLSGSLLALMAGAACGL